jgi:VWFA-related protein
MTKLILIILILAPAAFSPIFSRSQEEKIREEVSVTNVEVPVRVFYKGKVIDNLTRKDFKLYEDKELQTINGFYLKRRKIKVQNIDLTTDNREAGPLPPRFFVLVFRLTNYTKDIKRGVAHLFDNVLRDKDHVLVFVNDKTLFLNRSYQKVKRKDILDQVLREESVRANQRLVAYFTKIQRSLNVTKVELKMEDEEGRKVSVTARPDQLLIFLKKYLSTWIEYKKKYLLPDIDKYYNFANFLEKIDKEKWVINFYQFEMFPKMKYSGELRQQIEDIMNTLLVGRSEDIVYSRMMLSLLTKIDQELNVAKDFHADEISKLFYKVDATCHSIFCGTQKDTLSQDLEYRRISTDIENSLRDITEKTGGALISSNDLESALHSISEKEDVYYMLTYSPKNPKKTGQIKIVVDNKKYKVFYDTNMRADYIKEYVDKKRALSPSIKLNSISFKEKKLAIAISNFLMRKTGAGKKGKISVHVRIKDENNKTVFEKSRFLVPDKKITNITIDFDWIKKGEYNIIVDVSDILTGKTAMEFLQPQVN